MKIRSMQTCIMSSLPRCIFRCSVFRYVTLVSFFSLFFFKLCYLIVTLLLWWRINTYLLTRLPARLSRYHILLILTLHHRLQSDYNFPDLGYDILQKLSAPPVFDDFFVSQTKVATG